MRVNAETRGAYVSLRTAKDADEAEFARRYIREERKDVRFSRLIAHNLSAAGAHSRRLREAFALAAAHASGRPKIAADAAGGDRTLNSRALSPLSRETQACEQHLDSALEHCAFQSSRCAEKSSRLRQLHASAATTRAPNFTNAPPAYDEAGIELTRRE